MTTPVSAAAAVASRVPLTREAVRGLESLHRRERAGAEARRRLLGRGDRVAKLRKFGLELGDICAGEALREVASLQDHGVAP